MQALYDLGGLIEHDLNGISATVLARANLLVPNQEPIVTELASALERDLRFHEAYRILREATYNDHVFARPANSGTQEPPSPSPAGTFEHDQPQGSGQNHAPLKKGICGGLRP